MYSAPWLTEEHAAYADMVHGFLVAEALPSFEK